MNDPHVSEAEMDSTNVVVESSRLRWGADPDRQVELLDRLTTMLTTVLPTVPEQERAEVLESTIGMMRVL